MRIKDTYGKAKDIDTVKKCLELLSEEQRMVVLAYYYDDMSVKEMADNFETSEDIVRSRLYLARKRLMMIVEEEDEKKGYKSFVACIPVLISALDDIMETDIDFVTEETVMAKINKNIYTLDESIQK